jgi:hypothetical protein
MNEPQTEYRNLLVEITKGRELPAGYDGWGIRTVDLDFTSQHGYRYPYPGRVAEAPGPIIRTNTGSCPSAVGDGICAALNWRGMASGGASARMLLLIAYRDRDVLGRSTDKLRCAQFLVVDVLSGEGIVRQGRDANLRGANLYGADLRGADLYGANLRGANLRDADLYGADLYGANLRDANLRRADLRDANLRGADLYGADLRGADLYGALTDQYTRLPEGVTIP